MTDNIGGRKRKQKMETKNKTNPITQKNNGDTVRRGKRSEKRN